MNSTSANTPVRMGIDLGGSKIAGIVLRPDGGEAATARLPTPRDDYQQTIAAIAAVVDKLQASAPDQLQASEVTVGIGMPGSISPHTGLVQNANSTWLNAKPLQADIEAALGQPIRLANDANCFAASEAADGAGRGAETVFGVILGTGVGGGISRHGQMVVGPNAIAGEWGHNPLPWPTADEYPGRQCWCGRLGCMETWVSGPAMSRDHAGPPSDPPPPTEIAEQAKSGDSAAAATLERYIDRLARGLAAVTNIIDPDVIVLGGGLSKISQLYQELPGRIARHVFADRKKIDVRPPRWGDASGVRGAARLWNST